MNILIKDGLVIDPANNVESVTDLAIQNGKVIAIGDIPADFTADQVINASNKLVLPGIIDLREGTRGTNTRHPAGPAIPGLKSL